MKMDEHSHKDPKEMKTQMRLLQEQIKGLAKVQHNANKHHDEQLGQLQQKASGRSRRVETNS